MATKQNSETQNKIWRIRIAIVERQSIVIQCNAIIDTANAGSTWANWQELQDRAMLAQVTIARVEREIGELQNALRAL